MSNLISETADGSFTLFSERFNAHYHSTHGAVNESLHVFIEYGLNHVLSTKSHISILEVGLGTGLNAGLTFDTVKDLENVRISYLGLEPYPIDPKRIDEFNFSNYLSEDGYKGLKEIHHCAFNEPHLLNSRFTFLKKNELLQEVELLDKVDLIYYDAFGPNAQQELWTPGIFIKLFQMLNTNGVLTTYCAQGRFKRILKACGFKVISKPGPKGKREMTMAIKEN